MWYIVNEGQETSDDTISFSHRRRYLDQRFLPYRIEK